MTNALFHDMAISTSPVTIAEPTILEDIKTIDIDIYPNPVSDQLHIRLPQPGLISHIRIFAMDGRELHYFETLSPEAEIDMKDFIPGMYVVTVISSGMILQEKLIRL